MLHWLKFALRDITEATPLQELRNEHEEILKATSDGRHSRHLNIPEMSSQIINDCLATASAYKSTSKRRNCARSERFVLLSAFACCDSHLGPFLQGVSVQNNGWRVLDKLNVPPIPPESYFRNGDRRRNEHW